jgi:hypothetical protein
VFLLWKYTSVSIVENARWKMRGGKCVVENAQIVHFPPITRFMRPVFKGDLCVPFIDTQAENAVRAFSAAHFPQSKHLYISTTKTLIYFTI